MPQFALRLAYDGTDFSGWWRQPEKRCVASHLDQAGVAIGEPQLACIGLARTDAGVHARCQIVAVTCQRPWQPEQLCQALNQHLAADCRCLAVAPVSEDWDVLAASSSKTYSYACDCSAWGLPFQRRWAWRPPQGADWLALLDAAKTLEGQHDFACFLRRGDHRQDSICTMHEIRWQQEGDLWRCWLRGDRFIYRLARSLVGCMWSIARDPTLIEALAQALSSGRASPVTMQQAPAHGLCLEDVCLVPELDWSA